MKISSEACPWCDVHVQAREPAVLVWRPDVGEMVVAHLACMRRPGYVMRPEERVGEKEEWDRAEREEREHEENER